MVFWATADRRIIFCRAGHVNTETNVLERFGAKSAMRYRAGIADPGIDEEMLHRAWKLHERTDIQTGC